MKTNKHGELRIIKNGLVLMLLCIVLEAMVFYLLFFTPREDDYVALTARRTELTQALQIKKAVAARAEYNDDGSAEQRHASLVAGLPPAYDDAQLLSLLDNAAKRAGITLGMYTLESAELTSIYALDYTLVPRDEDGNPLDFELPESAIPFLMVRRASLGVTGAYPGVTEFIRVIEEAGSGIIVTNAVVRGSGGAESAELTLLVYDVPDMSARSNISADGSTTAKPNPFR